MCYVHLHEAIVQEYTHVRKHNVCELMTMQHTLLTLTLIDKSIDFLLDVHSNLHKFVNQGRDDDANALRPGYINPNEYKSL